jgi:hypothetical protein
MAGGWKEEEAEEGEGEGGYDVEEEENVGDDEAGREEE